MISMKRDATGIWVSPGHDLWFEAIPCPECSGTGEVEIDVPRPHNFNRDIGYIDTKTGTCENCDGFGAVQKEDENDE